jgi:hypothetical protein
MATVLLAACLLPAAAPVPPGDGKAKPVEYTVHSGHFEKNTAGLKGEASYLALTDKAVFDQVFGAAFTSGRKPNVVPQDAFEKKLVAAVVKRGNAPWTYKVEGVTLDGGTLTVKYTATQGQAGTATFASPLIVSADRAGVKKVEFVENGKPAGTAEVK